MSSTYRSGSVQRSPQEPDGSGDGPHDGGGTTGRAGRGKDRPRRPKSPLWARLLVASGSTLVLLAGGAIAAEKTIMQAATGNIDRISVDAFNKDSNGEKKHASVNGAKNILLVGIDPRGQDTADGIRSDSIIMLHISAMHDQAYMVSIPRDTYVEIPAYNNGAYRTSMSHDKINASFAWGALKLSGKDALAHGMDSLAKTISHNWNISFDAGAIVDFGGFQQVVNYIGGVDMYVDETVRSIHIGYDKNGKTVSPAVHQSASLKISFIPGITPKTYTVGWHHLAGWEALDYCRQRDLLANNDSDYGRQRHQQQFIKAVFKKIFDQYLGNATKLPGIIAQVGKTMTVSDGGVSLDDWVYAMRGIGADALVTIKTNNGQFNPKPDNHSYETLSADSVALFDALRRDDIATFVGTHPSWVASANG